MATEESKSPKVSIPHRKRSPQPTLSETKDSILSPGFRSAAAVAGWDEEALLLATLIVEDTPVRESRSRKRPHHPITSPPSNNSTRKRRSARRPPDAIPPIVLCLDEDDDKVVVKEKEGGGGGEEEKGKGFKDSAETAAAGKGLACMDRLREELSCAICLEICFEPSTTPCGHSFCLKCLKCAAAKCGKRCPKCRQIISIGRACTVNTVLWNTIQLLFPEVVEERKKAITATSRSRGGAQSRSPESIENRRDTNSSMRSSSSRIATQAPRASENYRSIRRRRPVSNQAEDAALALRLQREEFMVAFQDNRGQTNTDRYGGRHRYA